MTWMEKLKAEHLDTPENIMFLLGIQFQKLHPGILEYISKFPRANLLGSVFTEIDNGEIVIKSEYLETKFTDFVKALKEYGMGTDGHISNPQDWSIQITSAESKREFDLLLLEYPDLNIDFAAKTISRFYEKGMRTKFPKFLRNDVRMLL